MSYVGDSTQGLEGGGASSWEHGDDVRTIPELGAELRALRHELAGYISRHDREHDALRNAVERETADICRDIESLSSSIDAHDSWIIKREAYEQLVRWLVGSNVGVLVGLIITMLALASGNIHLGG